MNVFEPFRRLERYLPQHNLGPAVRALGAKAIGHRNLQINKHSSTNFSSTRCRDSLCSDPKRLISAMANTGPVLNHTKCDIISPSITSDGAITTIANVKGNDSWKQSVLPRCCRELTGSQHSGYLPAQLCVIAAFKSPADLHSGRAIGTSVVIKVRRILRTGELRLLAQKHDRETLNERSSRSGTLRRYPLRNPALTSPVSLPRHHFN